jgi:sulfur carrier protein
VKLIVNGEVKVFSAGLTVEALVRELGLEKNPIAIELNREVLPRSRHGQTLLAEGDRLEIVTLVGGG